MRACDDRSPFASKQDLLVDPHMLSTNGSAHSGELNSFIVKQKSIAEARAELGRSGFAHEHGRRHGHGHGESCQDSGMVLYYEEVKLSSS